MPVSPGGPVSQREEVQGRFRLWIGVVLVTAGVLMGLWVFASAYSLFTNPQKLEVFKTIIPEEAGLRTLEMDGEEVELPPGLFRFLGYVVASILLFIAGSVGGGFISGGVSLLQPGVARVERAMRRELEGLGAKLEKAVLRIADRKPE